MSQVENLWTPRELAVFLGYSPSTLASMVSKQPQRLPPRVAGLGRPRWVPDIVRKWVVQQSVPVAAEAPRGRPRQTPAV